MAIIAIERLERSRDEQLGQARIRGTRVTVHAIVLEHRDDHRSAEEIASMFELKLADVYAALAYYYDNQPIIDQEMVQNEAEYAAEAARHPSALHDKLGRLGLTIRDIVGYLERNDQAALAKVRQGQRPDRE